MSVIFKSFLPPRAQMSDSTHTPPRAHGISAPQISGPAHDSSRQHQQAERPPAPLHRSLGGAAEGREGRPGRSERRRQDHAVPHDHRRGAARRGPGRGRARRHHRLFQPGRRRDGGPQRGRRGDGRRRPGERGRGRTEGARSRHGRPGSGRRDGRDRRALRRGAGALRGTRRLRARRPRARGAQRARLQPGDDGRRRRRAVGRLEDARARSPASC